MVISVQDWGPHMSFVLKGSQIVALQLKGWFKSKMSIQEYRNEIKKVIANLCIVYMVHVFSTMWCIKNEPSNSTSCIDNVLRLLVLVAGRLYWELKVTSSFSIWGCIWRVVLRDVYFEGPNRVWRALKTSILNTGDEWLAMMPSGLRFKPHPIGFP